MKGITVIIICMFIATLSHASPRRFYEKGQYYLIITRIDAVKHCKLVELAPQEAVFLDCAVLKGSRHAGMNKGAVMEKFIKSTDRLALLEANPLKNIPVSYARANITALKLIRR